MFKFLFCAFMLYCVFVAFTMEDEEMVGETETVPSSSYSSSEATVDSDIEENIESETETQEENSENSETIPKSGELVTITIDDGSNMFSDALDAASFLMGFTSADSIKEPLSFDFYRIPVSNFDEFASYTRVYAGIFNMYVPLIEKPAELIKEHSVWGSSFSKNQYRDGLLLDYELLIGNISALNSLEPISGFEQYHYDSIKGREELYSLYNQAYSVIKTEGSSSNSAPKNYTALVKEIEALEPDFVIQLTAYMKFLVSYGDLYYESTGMQLFNEGYLE